MSFWQRPGFLETLTDKEKGKWILCSNRKRTVGVIVAKTKNGRMSKALKQTDAKNCYNEEKIFIHAFSSASRYLSASIAAMQPVPAAVTA